MISVSHVCLCVMFSGLVSQSFELSDQPNFGTWNIRVDAFVSISFLSQVEVCSDYDYIWLK